MSETYDYLRSIMVAVSKILGHDDKIASYRPFPWKTVDAPAKFGNSVINFGG